MWHLVPSTNKFCSCHTLQNLVLYKVLLSQFPCKYNTESYSSSMNTIFNFVKISTIAIQWLAFGQNCCFEGPSINNAVWQQHYAMCIFPAKLKDAISWDKTFVIFFPTRILHCEKVWGRKNKKNYFVLLNLSKFANPSLWTYKPRTELLHTGSFPKIFII